MPKPLRTFRVYPEGNRLYFDVYLWRTLGEMRRYVREVWEVSGRAAWAWTIIPEPAHCPKSGKRLPIVGEIHLARRYCQLEIVAHEVGHAAIAWAQRRGVQIVDDDGEASHHEERFCYATGRMNQRILDTLRAEGYLQ